jgi:hypothetical protein
MMPNRPRIPYTWEDALTDLAKACAVLAGVFLALYVAASIVNLFMVA